LLEYLRHLPRLLREAVRVQDGGLPPIGDRRAEERLLGAQVELATPHMRCDSSRLGGVIRGNPFIPFILVFAEIDRRNIEHRDVERPEWVQRLPGEVGTPIRRSSGRGQLRRIGGGMVGGWDIWSGT
jgi:hypothetical protein